MINQIKSILRTVTLGILYMKTALILRDSMFINAVVTNSEGWNFFSVKNVKTFDDSDC